jgi:CheY-like chemotaxis protein
VAATPPIDPKALAEQLKEARAWTPMNGVLGMAERLNDTALTTEQREYIDVLTSSARSLLRVVDDILDYSEIEAGTMALERAPSHLHRCIGDTLRLLAPAAGAKGLELVGYVDPTLPETVTGDLTRLRRVVRDTGAGGPGLGFTITHRLLEMMGGRLWVDSTPHGSACHFTFAMDATPQLSLADTYRGRLFGAHALLVHDDEATRDALGLTLERCGVAPTGASTAEALRRLRARDPRIDVVLLGLPHGDVATLLADVQAVSPALPVLLLASPQEAARCGDLPVYAFLATPVPAPALLAAVSAALLGTAPGVPRPPRRDRFRGVRVLVAEDNPINQQVITLMLEGWGASVTVAPSGRDALAPLDGERFDLVLMDVQMPDGDGSQTTTAIRARESGPRTRTPIVALTAQREDRMRCLEAGMDDYLSKPVVPAELADALERLVAADGSRA